MMSARRPLVNKIQPLGPGEWSHTCTGRHVLHVAAEHLNCDSGGL